MSAPAVSSMSLPVPLGDELVRSRLLDRMRHRWDHPVTVVLAGAGFGKSTLLGQAVRDNAVSPRGIDVWFACSPGDENADQLGTALLTALGGTRSASDLSAALASALADYSPLDVSLMLDDAHLIRPGSSGCELISALMRRLPANAHLVLGARQDPPGSLARLRAADRLLVVDQHELTFTEAESAQLAARLGGHFDKTEALGGWPALVRLALAAGPDVAFDFAREEVLGRLAVAERRAVFVLAHLGYADVETVAALIDADVDLPALAERVPLISRTRAGLFRAHDLWRSAAARVLEPAETVQLRQRLVASLTAGGQLARAGAIALAYGDADALAGVALALISRTVSVLPLDTVRPWLVTLRRAHPDGAVTAVLDAAIRQAEDYRDIQIDVRIDHAATGFRRDGNAGGEIAALAIGSIGAHARDDLARITELAARAATIPGAVDHPVVNLGAQAMAAVVAEMSGHPEDAVRALRSARSETLSGGLATAAQRFLWHCLLITGRADEAVEVGTRLEALGETSLRCHLAAYAHWTAGNPEPLLALGGPVLDEPGLSARDAFVRGPSVAAVLASLGQRRQLRDLVDALQQADRSVASSTQPCARDAALTAMVLALAAVTDYREVVAARTLADVVSTHSGSPVLEQHLRRHLALGYVLHPELRARWDGADLGPSQVRARTVARLLVDLRAGIEVSREAVEPTQVLTTLPLPWSVEVACRLHARGHPAGAPLAAWLVDRVPDAALTELRRWAAAAQTPSPRPVVRAAAELLSRLPAEPPDQLRISVLGPLEIAFDGVRVAPAGLRRARVRTLLALLVVHRTLSREMAADLLWPELDAADGARNLRVTLSYLRQVVEPGRLRGEAPFHVRADGSTIWLHPSKHLVVDLWELQRLCAEATELRQQSAADQAVTRLDAAIAQWRGEPLIDLGAVAGQEAAIDQARVLYLGALLDTGELRLAQGEPAASLLAAERVLALDPYSERGHRLALSAALHTHDRARVRVVARRFVASLDELGVAPSVPTQILLRQAAVVLRPAEPARVTSSSITVRRPHRLTAPA